MKTASKLTRLALAFSFACLLTAPAALAADAPKLTVTPNEFGGVYHPAEEIKLNLVFVGPPPDKLEAVIKNDAGKQVGTVTLEPPWFVSLGTGHATVILCPAGKNPGLGYYTVEVSAGDVKAATALAIVPVPRTDVDSEISPMGFVVWPGSRTPDELAGYLRAARRMGTRWISIDVAMSVYAPDAETIDFVKPAAGRLNIDPIVELAVKEKMLVNQKLFGVPAWMASDSSPECRSPWYRDCYTSRIANEEGYKKVVQTMAAKYAGRIRSYEFGNSPYREPRYYSGTNADFIHDLKLSHDAVKAGDPTALVSAAGFVQETDLVDDILKSAPDTIDVLTVHYITAPLSQIVPATHYHELFKATGVSKPMWDTSAIGVPKDDLALPRGHNVTVNTPGAHQEGCIRSYVRNRSLGVTRTMLSALNIPGTHVNIFTGDNQPTPQVCEYAVTAEQIDGAEYVGPATLGATKMEGYYFRRGDDTFLVAWCITNGSGAVLTLPAAGDKCTVVDRYGNAKQLPATEGKVKVPVGFRPVFVHGVKAQ